MKYLFIFLTTLIALKSYGQDLSANYQKQRQQIEENQTSQQKVVFNRWATENKLSPGHAYSACDGWPGVGYKCRLHNLQCCYKGCAASFETEHTSVDNAYKSKLDQLQAQYEAANAAAQKKAQEESDKEAKNNALMTPDIAKQTLSATSGSKEQQYQQAAANNIASANNSANDITKSLNLNLAKINASAAGNQAQTAQIQQQLNINFQHSLSNVISQLNDMTARNAQRNADEGAYINEEEDKQKRGWLYECIGNYSFWYLDTSLFIQTASSAISYRSGQPDLFLKPHENYQIESIRDAIKSKNFDAFYSSLIDPSHIDNVGQMWWGPSMREDFDNINYSFDGDVKQQQKLINKIQKNADKGDPIAAFNLFSYYLTPKYNEPASQKAERLQNADKYFDIASHRLLLSKAIYTPLIITMYFMRAEAAKEPATKLSYLQEIDTLTDINGFNNFPAKLLPGNFSKYYSTEFYYYLTYLNGWGKIKVYHDLYKLEGASATKNDKYFNSILNEYLNIGINLRPMFQDKKLRRPFTDDDKWNEHHPERNH